MFNLLLQGVRYMCNLLVAFKRSYYKSQNGFRLLYKIIPAILGG